jgi:hypothetical protein
MEQLAVAVAASRMPVEYDGTRFSGPGYEWLLTRGSQAGAFLLGEEHGIAENPKLAAQLFAALVPKGYRHVAIEISSPMATALDEALRTGGAAALKGKLTTPESRVAFFGMREEADWLVAAHAALHTNRPFLWGLDYEVGADRYLIAQLQRASKPLSAQTALARLAGASAASWALYAETRSPQYIYGFAGDPQLVRELSEAWPRADQNSRLVMDTLEQTFAINRLWFEKKVYESNLLRSRFMRKNLLRYWRERRGHDDRLFMKFGASHLVRGANMSDVFDIGSLVAELLVERGSNSFHLMVLPGPGRETASLDPAKFVYVPGNRDQYGEGMELFDRAIIPGKFTVFDTASLRPLAKSYGGGVPLPLWRVIHGFDALLIMTGSHPSSNL